MTKESEPEPAVIMKALRSIPIFLAVIAPQVMAQNAPVSAMRDAATHQQIAAVYQKALQADPMRNLKPAKGSDPSVVNRPKSLLSESDIISFGGLATLVPKHAIMQVPASCTERLKFEAGAKLVSWADFYAANRGWITTVEIGIVQAEGKQALAEETKKMMGKCRNLMVATYQGGPISLLPPKAAAKPAATPAATTPATTPSTKPSTTQS
jgi:hypothetical protein